MYTQPVYKISVYMRGVSVSVCVRSVFSSVGCDVRQRPRLRPFIVIRFKWLSGCAPPRSLPVCGAFLMARSGS